MSGPGRDGGADAAPVRDTGRRLVLTFEAFHDTHYREWLRFAQGWYLVIYAGFVMALLVYSPSGLLGVADRWVTARKTRRASAARAAAAPTLDSALGPEAR